MTTAMTTKENGNLAQPEAPRSWASAPVDVFEGAHEYLVFADVPGVNKEDIDITFERGELRLHASRAPEDRDAPSDYRRTFTVGRDVDVDKITAELEHGVLQVHLPKLESAKPRQITIRSA
jgi:HSP20 family molecular chaperone IbpA